MKTIYSSLIFSLIFLSCRQEVLQYSCDPVLNEIVTSHIQEYVQFTVKDLIVYDLHAQQAIFRSYTPEKKREIWLEKIHYLLENEGYSSEEYVHVAKLLELLHENCFNPGTIKAEALQRTQFNASWISYAQNSLGWSEKYIAFVVYRLYTNQTQFEAETKAFLSLKRKAAADSENGDCLCNDSLFCGLGSSCIDNGCDKISQGCGLLWKYDCVGQCL